MKKHKIMLYNTLTRKKEEFVPQNPDMVTIYSCGQTVYEDVHVGNAKTYVVWDVLVRTLRHFGYNVKHVQNFTDLGHLTDDADQGEDKIVRKAKLLKKDPMELVDEKIQEYHKRMDAINVHRPNIAPRATGHIIEMQDMVRVLLEKKHAYESNGSIYYDITSFEKYGELARLDLENLKAGARVDVIEGKRNPGDFALWIKAPKEHIMQYTSPWGKGYPGWHLECSVMAMKYLGDTLDIHAGGMDHIPVHHTNEIAQSEGATGKKFANFWLHSAFITVNGEKMSKSLNNFITLGELIEKYGRYVARFSLTQAHYRTQADFSFKQVDSLKKRYFRMIRIYHLGIQHLHRNGKEIKRSNDDLSSKEMELFDKALADDLNVPKAHVQINAVSSKIDKYRKENNLEQLCNYILTFEEMMSVLGIPFIHLNPDEIDRVDNLVNLRINLKLDGKFDESDKIRDFLTANGYILQDISKTDTVWYRERD